MTKYRFKRIDRAASDLDGIEFCYDQSGCDYGLASDDSRLTGIEHVTVTLNSNGDYPGFTIPKEDLIPVEVSP